jgi:type VI protein secretion system component VasF
MGLFALKIRRIIERHPLPDKHLNDILQQWMIELAEELADNLLENVEASEKLASKEDIHQLRSDIKEDIHQIRSDIKEMRQETKDDIKQLIEMSNTRFESLRQEMNARFEAQQKETNALRQEMNARFEALQRQIAFMQWWFSIGGGITLLLIILKLFFPHIFPH